MIRPTWDAANGQIRLGDKVLDLTTRQKAFMRIVGAKPGRLVTRREIEATGLFNGTDAFQDTRNHIRERMRAAFGDDSALVTVVAQGTRWVGDVTNAAEVASRFVLTTFGEPMAFEPAVRQAKRDGFVPVILGVSYGSRIAATKHEDGRFMVLSETPEGTAFMLCAGKLA